MQKYPVPKKIKAGYNSHGYWSTLEKIGNEEIERGNPFPKLNYPSNTPAIWICLTARKALRYLALAESWDHLNNEAEPLTKEEKKLLKEIAKIPLNQSDVIVCDDGEKGYLVLRLKKTREVKP